MKGPKTLQEALLALAEEWRKEASDIDNCDGYIDPCEAGASDALASCAEELQELLENVNEAIPEKVKSYSWGDSMGQEVTAGDGKLTPYTCHFVVRWVRKLLPGMDR